MGALSWIRSVKEQQDGGWRINNSLAVPDSPGNRHASAVAQWIAEGNIPEPWETEQERQDRLDREEREGFKRQRSQSVRNITVTTTAGNTFDGDEDSQNRMTRALLVLDDGETIPWTLADNSVIDATKAELAEALRLAGQAQSALWQPASAKGRR